VPTKFRVSSIIPTGLIVDSVVQDGGAIIVTRDVPVFVEIGGVALLALSL
jgi:hypothetical protein